MSREAIEGIAGKTVGRAELVDDGSYSVLLTFTDGSQLFVSSCGCCGGVWEETGAAEIAKALKWEAEHDKRAAERG